MSNPTEGQETRNPKNIDASSLPQTLPIRGSGSEQSNTISPTDSQPPPQTFTRIATATGGSISATVASSLLLTALPLQIAIAVLAFFGTLTLAPKIDRLSLSKTDSEPT